MNEFIRTGSARRRCSGAPIRCRYADEHKDTVCSRTEAAKVRCQEVAKNGGYTDLRIAASGTILHNTFSIPDYSKGTNPVAEIFWYCDKGMQVKTRLEKEWTCKCVPIMLTGQVLVI